MKRIIILCSLFIVLCFTACKKENVVQAVSSSNNSVKANAESNGKWEGVYYSGRSPIYVDDTTFIRNGVAHLKSRDFPEYRTDIELNIPKNKSFDADSATVVVRIKNPEGLRGSRYPYDARILIDAGSKNVYVEYSAEKYLAELSASGDYWYSPIYNKVLNDWTVVILKCYGYHAAASERPFSKEVNVVHDNMGRIEILDFYFRGSGFIDWIKLYYGKPDRLIMEENFDGPGSNVIWYE